MPLEIRTVTVYANNITVPIYFSQNISQYLVGISQYRLRYPENTEHNVQTLSISLMTNCSGNELQIIPQARLCDHSGHEMDPANSSITIEAIAWVGMNDSELQLASTNGIANNGSNPVSVPCTNPLAMQAALTGFDLSYGSEEHHINNYSCAVGSQPQGGYNANITASATMADISGHSAASATCNGGLIANCDPSLPLTILPTSSLQGDIAQTLIFPNTVNSFRPLLTKVQAQYPTGKDYRVHAVEAGLRYDAPVKQGDTVHLTVTGFSYLLDNSGHAQDDKLSFVAGSVIGFWS